MINNYTKLSTRSANELRSQKMGVFGRMLDATGSFAKTGLMCVLLLSFLVSFGNNPSNGGTNSDKNKKAMASANVAAVTTCANAIPLSAASLPITAQALVCGTTNDLNATNVPATCGAASNSYKGGNESLYTLTPTTTGSYTISIAGQSWTGIFVYAGCPTAGGTCVNATSSSGSAKSLSVTLTAGVEYFIWFDTWPSPASPCPGTFSIVPPPAGCTGTPVASTINGASQVCANLGTTLSLSTSYAGLSGISYQWKSSTTPGGPYTNMGTAASQATGNLTTTTYYVCDIICAGGSTFTTPEKEVLVNALPTVTAFSSAPSYCNPGGTAVNLTSGGATTYLWSPSAGLSGTSGNTVSATPTSTTTYTVTGTDGNGCQNIATATVTVFGVPQGVTATATPATVCVGGTSTLSAAAAVPSSVRDYTFAASTATYTPLVGGINSTATGDDGTQTSIPLGFPFTYNAQSFTTFGISTNGTIQLGTSATSFSNSLSTNTNVIAPFWDDNNRSTGTISYLVTGVAPNRVLTVDWNAISVSGGGSSTNSVSSFQIQLFETSNKISFIYGSLGSPVSTPSASIGLSGASGSFLSVTPAALATSSTVTENSNINSVAFLPSGTVYTFTPPTATFTWSPAGDVVDANSQTTLTNGLSATQTFTVIASNNICTAAPASATVTISPLSCTAATYTSPNCAGSDFTVTANISGGGAPYSYSWSDGAGGVYPDAATITANLPAGTYNFVCVVTDSCGATCTSSVSVTVNGLPIVTVSPVSALYCNPSTPIALTASGAATYAWSPATGLSATTGNVVNASPSSTTTYTVVGTDVNGCVASAASSTITVQPGPTPISVSSSAATVCNGTVVTLTANGGNVSTSSTFAAVGSTPIIDNTYNTLPVSVSGLPANAVISKIEMVFDVTHTWDSDVQLNLQSPNGKIINLVSGAGGSGDNFSNTTVTSDPSAPAFSTGSAPFANGVYTASLLDLAVLNSTTSFSELFAAPFNGTWTIQTFDTVGGDTGTLNSASIRIFYSAPTNTSWTASSGTLYTSVNPDVAYVAGENAAILYARPTTATTYAASASLGGCTSIGSTSVAVNQLPVFSVAPITICNGTTGTLVASSLESNSYSWTPVGGGTTLSGASVMVSPSETTIYNVTATSNTTVPACSSTIQVTVTVNEPGTIESATASRTVSPGQLTTFEVVTTGLVTYQWQLNDNVNGWQDILAANPDYSGENTAVLSVQNITLGFDTYQYRCLVTGLAPCATLTPIEAILNVTNTGFSTQPADVNLCGQSSTSFSIVTTGDEPYNVQWQMSTDGGASFNDIFDGLDASGLTFSGVNEFSPKTLFVSGITTIHSGYQFKCQLDFFLDSGIATLTVNTPVTLTNNFSTTPVVRCNTPSAAATSFGISTTGSVAGVEWKYATSASGPWNTIAAGTPVGASYSGADSNTLSVTTNGSTPVGNYYYKAFVTGSGSGANKCADVESAVATVSVANPTITVSPSAAAYCTPGPAVTLTASGSDINSYSWTASGFTTTTGTSIAVTPAEATTYTVTGTDSNGCTNTAQATVTVGGSFSLAATSSAATVCPGNPVSLNAVPTPLSGVSYLVNAVPYQFNASSGSFTPLTGTVATAISGTADDTNSTSQPIGFSFNFGGTNYTNFRVNSNGLFSFGAGNTAAFNSLTSTTTGVRPGIAPLWDDLQCSSAGVRYQVSGTAPNRVLTVEWLNMEWNWSSSQNAISFQVKLYEGTNAVALVYRSEAPAGNPGGSGGASVGLMGTAGSNFISLQNLSAAPTISTTSSTDNIATKPASGQTYLFTPVAPVTYTYAWSSAPSGFTAGTAATTASPAANTTYNVVATSNAGCTATASVAVAVDAAAPIITTQPVTQELCQGTTATLSVVASSATALSYQWFKNGSPLTNGTGISGATSATLTLTGTTPATSGTYTVTVTNCSTVTSEAAVLTVYPTPTAVAPAPQAYCFDATVPATPLVGTPSGVTFNISGGAALGLPNQTGVTEIPSFSPTASGVATIAITPVANGCPGATVNYILRINALPTIPVLASNSAICQDSTLELSASVAPLSGYVLNSNSGVSFIDISASGTSVGTISDDSEHNITIPSFTFNNVPYTTARVGNNGVLVFGATAGDINYTNLALPAGFGFNGSGLMSNTLGANLAAICAYWDDLTPGAGGSIRTQTVGDKFIVQWTNEDSFGATGAGTITYQIQLELTTGLIHIVYSDTRFSIDPATSTADNAGSATLGLNYSATDALQYSFNTQSITSGQSFTFTQKTYSYAWSGPNSFSATVQNPSIVGATPAASGTYTLEITDSNGCKSSASTDATVHPTPTAVAPANQVYYTGFVAPSIPLTGTPTGVTFDISGGAAAGLADVTGVTAIPSFIATGAVATVTITPQANGCTGLPVTYQIAPIPVVVNITSNICGGINHGLNNQIQAGSVSVPGYTVTGYQFEVTNTATGEVSIVQSSQSHFKLTDASNYAYGTTFTIRVAAILNGNVQGYFGNTCSLTTTEVQTSRVVTAQCGATLVFINSTINANAVNSTNLYRFRVALASAPTVTYTVERTVPNFRLTDVPGLPLLYDTEYLVDVQIRVRLAGFEAWSQYGLRCSVFTPTAPVTSLVDAQCEDYAVPSNTTQINAIAFPGATAYRFRLTGFDEFGDVNYQQEVTNATPSFTLSQFSGLTPGVTYAVAVSMNLFGTFTDYGKDCSIITPSMTKQSSIVEPFKATAYPNPFAANFMIDVKTTSDSVIAIKVYDMVGRLVEQRSVAVTELENAPIGNNYPSGVYNVVITQDETVQTVRVVKR